jgi:hypothetical protein
VRLWFLAFLTARYLEVSVQLQDPAALPTKKRLRYPFVGAGWVRGITIDAKKRRSLSQSFSV